MKYVIISGSHRESSQSLKISNWIKDFFVEESFEVISLGGNPIPFWSEDAWDKSSELTSLLSPTLQKLKEADGIIMIAPEWGGMAPAGLKNLLLYAGPQHLGNKPCLLVGVSSGRGGSYPISELRMSGYKNTKIVYIPDHLIVQDVMNVCNNQEIGEEKNDDTYIKNRIVFSVKTLFSYAKALAPIRKSGELDSDLYKYGM